MLRYNPKTKFFEETTTKEPKEIRCAFNDQNTVIKRAGITAIDLQNIMLKPMKWFIITLSKKLVPF